MIIENYIKIRNYYCVGLMHRFYHTKPFFKYLLPKQIQYTNVGKCLPSKYATEFNKMKVNEPHCHNSNLDDIQFNQNKYVNIQRIIFDNFVNLNADIDIWIPNNENIYKDNLRNIDVIHYHDLMKYKPSLNPVVIGRVQHYNEIYNKFHKEVLTECSFPLQMLFLNKIFFNNSFEMVDLTKFTRLVNVSGEELFMQMTEPTSFYSRAWECYEPKKGYGGYKCFDKCGYYELNMCYPTDVHKQVTMLKLQPYLSSSGVEGYKRLIHLFEHKMKINQAFDV
jgi:hypothetical protein